MLAKDFAVS